MDPRGLGVVGKRNLSGTRLQVGSSLAKCVKTWSLYLLFHLPSSLFHLLQVLWVTSSVNLLLSPYLKQHPALLLPLTLYPSASPTLSQMVALSPLDKPVHFTYLFYLPLFHIPYALREQEIVFLFWNFMISSLPVLTISNISFIHQ